LEDLEIGKLVLNGYPNPFRDFLNIEYDLPADAKVSISLLDNRGVTVRELVSELQIAGRQTYQLSAKQDNLTMGAYYIRMLVQINGKTYQRILKLAHIY